MTTAVKSFEKSGLGYTLKLDDLSTELRIHRLRRSSGELTGELAIRTRLKDVKTVSGVLHAARFNLSSSTARERLAKTLSARTPGLDLDWFLFLEELAQRTLEAEDRGDPVEEVGRLPVDRSTPRFAIDPLMPLAAPTLIYGPGGTGKSMFATACALSVAAGREIVPGFAPAIKGRVLYLDWETSRDTINRRLIAVAAGVDVEVPRGIFYRRQHRALSDDAEELASVCSEHQIIFVVIDSAGGAIGSQGDYGDANEGALKLFEAIRHLGNVSTLIVDHVSKQELVLAGKRGKVPYGSIYKINYSRQAWELRPSDKQESGEPLRVALHDFKRNDTPEHAPIGVRVDWQTDTIAFAADDVSSQSTATPSAPPEPDATLGDRIMELLEGARMKAPQIADTLGANPGTVRTQLNRDDRFERDANGYWIVAREHIL